MTGLKKSLSIVFCTAICVSLIFLGGSTSYIQASESSLKDENKSKLEEVTGVDKDGDVFLVDEDIKDENNIKERMSVFSAKSSSDKIVNFRTKGNAVTNFTEVSTGVSGYTNGAYGADAAYLGTSNGKVKFMLSGVVGWVDADDVQVVNFSSAKSSSCYKVSGGRLIHYITCDMTTPGHATSLDNGVAPSYLKSGTTYYSYDGHYFYTSYSKMIADYQKNTRSNSVNKSNPYYNYYQYLPLRSKTSYSDSSLNTLLNERIKDYTSSSSKMKSTASTFTKYQDKYGVNALLMIGVAGNESAWGTSSICKSKNNLFGLNAVDSSPGTSASTYASIDECIKQFAESYMSKGYLNPNDWRMKGGFLGNKGSGINVSYASDPYWGEKAANMAYSLDKNGGRKDQGKYTIGIKDTINTTHNSVNVRNTASTSSGSKVLYNTDTYSNYAVLILNSKATNSFYKIQSEPVLNSSRTAISSSGAYNFDKMYAYISSDYVQIVNKGKDIVDEKKSLSSISIVTAPKKTSYTEGDKFNPEGMVVKAKFSDGTSSDVTKNIKYSTDALKAGATSIDIKYTYDGVTKSTSQKITVKEKVVVTVDKVLINPEKIDLNKGESKTFGVSVTGKGNPSKDVKWSVSGEKSSDTKISSTGLLKVASDETSKTLTVKAVSSVDTSKSATAVVNVIEKENDFEVTEPGDNGGDDSQVNKPDNGNEDVTKPEEDNGNTDNDGEGVTKPEEDNDGNTDNSNNSDNNNAEEEQRLENKEMGISVEGVLPENTILNVKEIDESNENYEELTEEVQNNTILGVYDISLSNELENGESVELGFNVGEKYEGKDVIVLHYNEVDGVIFTETYNAVVKDGNITVEVDGFSPYVVALDDAQSNIGNSENNNQNGSGPSSNGNNNVNVDKNDPIDDNSNISSNKNTDNNKKGNVSVSSVKSDSKDSVGYSTDTKDKKQDNNSASVKTADESDIVFWSMLFIISSVSVLSALFVLNRDKKHFRN